VFKIDEKQISAMEDTARGSFHQRMLIHIAEFFPEHDATLDEEQKRALIDHGIERGRVYEIVSERDVCIYVDLMLALGPDFDESETYPWAYEILTDDDVRLPRLKMDRLHARAIKEIEQREAV